MSLDETLNDAMTAIPECLASGYVDMETGMLLGVNTLDSHPQEVLDALAAATADLFQGPNVVRIEDMFRKSRGADDDDEHYFQEVIVFSKNLLHVFLRSPHYADHVICFVCRKKANPGMVLTTSRRALEMIADAA